MGKQVNRRGTAPGGGYSPPPPASERVKYNPGLYTVELLFTWPEDRSKADVFSNGYGTEASARNFVFRTLRRGHGAPSKVRVWHGGAVVLVWDPGLVPAREGFATVTKAPEAASSRNSFRARDTVDALGL